MAAKPLVLAAVMLLVSIDAFAVPAPGTQQGAKLVGSDLVPIAANAFSTALSSDGNTAILGGPYDNSSVGAAWIYTRSGGVWSQQGLKLVGTGAVGAAFQGWSVAISADGNTALVGGFYDNSQIGAVWVFTRTAGVWSQQGAKLTGSGEVGPGLFGNAVAISADGNTALVAGYYDTNDSGAVWVFTRSGGVWTQQGSKLVGTGSVGGPEQGYYARLSGDGNTAIVGGPLDNSNTGAAWVFTRSGSVWSQQGAKIVPSGFVGIPYMGQSVAVSGDGNTAMLGGPFDNFQTGAAWVFTRTAGVWTQHGSKLVGTGGVGTGYQGISVALSSDGYTALVGGSNDNANVGAGWVYVDPSAPAAVEPGALAGMLELAPPFPNPSAGRIAITFSLPRDADVSLGVYDVSGRFVRTLAQGATSAGSHSIQWDGRTASGRSAPGGLYFLNLRAGADELTRRFVLVK